MAKELVDAEPGQPSHSLTATIVPAVGIFYDRENSLLFCVVVAPRKDDKMSLNVCPGAIEVAGVSPGVVLAVGGARGLSFGVTLPGMPMGLGAHGR